MPYLRPAPVVRGEPEQNGTVVDVAPGDEEEGEAGHDTTRHEGAEPASHWRTVTPSAAADESYRAGPTVQLQLRRVPPQPIVGRERATERRLVAVVVVFTQRHGERQ